MWPRGASLGGNKIARRLLVRPERIPPATILTPKRKRKSCRLWPSVRPSATPRAAAGLADISLSAHCYIYKHISRATHLLPCSRQQQQTFIFRSSFFLLKRRPADGETRQAEKPTLCIIVFPLSACFYY